MNEFLETSLPVRRPVARAAALLCLGAFVAAASAQGVQKQRIEIIGVTPVPGASQPLADVPAQVQAADSADLERSQAQNVGEFMNISLAGVHINEVQGNGFQPDVSYRGFTASPLLGNPQGLSLYMDGVRLNQPFGDVASWDLIPMSAIDTLTLVSGSNPLYGLNTLGGALSIQTKSGRSHPGSVVTLGAGKNNRAVFGFESGGQASGGLHWFVTGQHHEDAGWRVNSRSRVNQLFGKVGQRFGDTDVSVTLAAAETRLNGNGLQEMRLLDADWHSVYTQPDQTRNRAELLNLQATHAFSRELTLQGNAYVRRLRTRTFNGDINDESLDQAHYQPSAKEQAALAAAGYTEFPTSGESAANTPFPKWRCIAQALLVDEPGEKCNGVNNQSNSRQNQEGFNLQLASETPLAGLANRFVVGAGFDRSRTRFAQSAELGYLNPDRTVTGVGAFGDGVTGGDIDGEPFDTRVDLSARTRTWSAFVSDTLSLTDRTRLTLSGRYDRTTVRNRDAIRPAGGTGSLNGDHRFSRFNPGVGLTFAATPSLSVYGSVQRGSRAPSAIELGCADPDSPCKLPNSMAGDPPLKQVVTTTAEAGLRGSSRAAGMSMQWQLGVFRADNRDDILFVAESTAGYGYFKNFGKTRRQGVEAMLATQVGPVRLSASYTWLDATYRSSEEVNGEGNSTNEEALDGFPGMEGAITIRPGDRIPLIPRQIAKLSADWSATGSLDLGVDVEANSGSYARGNENNLHQPDGVYYLGSGRSGGFAVVNLRAQWRPGRDIASGALHGWTFALKVANLFDRRYSTGAQLGFTGFNPDGSFLARPFPKNAEGEYPLLGSTFYAPGAPRTWMLSARYAF